MVILYYNYLNIIDIDFIEWILLMSSHTMGVFLFGMVGTTVLITLFRRDVPYPRTITVLVGVWAVLPQLAGEIPYLSPHLSWLQDHWISNVFWFHRLLDTWVDPADTDLFVGIMIVSILGTTIWAERRAYRPPDVFPSGE